jgi:hypothetical protein
LRPYDDGESDRRFPARLCGQMGNWANMDQPDGIDGQPRGIGAGEEAALPRSETAGELAAILDRYLADLQAGKRPDKDALVALHPDLAAQLEACLAGIEFIHRATAPTTDEPETLGEFRIIRELGRGGMGVVYEAEQTSLRRHVALKVLRFGGVADLDAMKRFQREAETVARLHHTNIVPIFAVGSERGVHYYAMQLIAGRSLADVEAEARRTGKPLPAGDVAAWGLQAAEALAHAHQRGVIHRDVKPSNLLLDSDGVVWLTDFGLAKRADEATLTVHGTLMGTPRYMSPEQAAALQQPIDARTDLYSLGASLFELATGHPLFAPASAHVVIAQILTEEPARPRQLRPNLPRDLETIILTCLAKEPTKRYPSALALAADLRAVIEGRPIQARRAKVSERVVRYVRQRRKTLKGAGLAVAATILFMFGAFAAWRYFSDWRLGRVVLVTDGPALSAQMLPEASDTPIGERFSIGAHSPVSLSAGDYRLQVQSPGLMGQTYRVAFNRGETRTHRVALDDTLLLGKASIGYPSIVAALPLRSGKADFIEWQGAKLIRLDGSTGMPIWDAANEAIGDSRFDDVAALLWMRGPATSKDQRPPGVLLQPAPDLNGDGTGDVVWGLYRSPSFAVFSGNDGSLLWTYTANPDGTGGPEPLPQGSPGQQSRLGRVVGEASAADVNSDGVLDLIAEFAVFDDPQQIMTAAANAGTTGGRPENVLPGRRIVVAVSGKTGKELWKHVIDVKPVDLPSEALDRGVTYVRQPGAPVVAIVVESKWIGLDPASGRPKGPTVDLGVTPPEIVRYVDLDGDGTMELLALPPDEGNEPFTVPILAAYSLATGKGLWSEKLMAYFKPQERVTRQEWIKAEDLDGDGSAEVVVPDVGALPHPGSRIFGGVRLLDGRTGQTRWAAPLWPGMISGSDSVAHLLIAPDLDADGTRDLIALSRFSGREPYTRFTGKPPEPKRVFVDALSGKDGRHIWQWHSEILNAENTPIWPAFWWGNGPDGWPLLAVPIGGSVAPGVVARAAFYTPDPPVVHLLAAATGIEAHTIDGMSWPRCADLDGDGLADLWGSVDNKLRGYRASPPEVWRALAGLQPAGDLDGDGINDVVSNDLQPHSRRGGKTDSRTILARSGRDGKTLWRTLLDPWEDWYFDGKWTRSYAFDPLELPHGDLDGDGCPDILVRRWSDGPASTPRRSWALPVQAVSGRTGRFLWSAGVAGQTSPGGSSPVGAPFIEGIAACASSAHGRPDVVVLYEQGFEGGPIVRGRFNLQIRLALLAGRDGRIVWDKLLTEHDGGASRLNGFTHEFADVDGDGRIEIVVLQKSNAASGPSPLELHVLSVASGETRWVHRMNPDGAEAPHFVIGDLDGDGRPEVVVTEVLRQAAAAVVDVTAVDGLTGKPVWTWRDDVASNVPQHKTAICLGDFEGSARKDVCVSFEGREGPRRVVILDSQGHKRASRDLKAGSLPVLKTADLDGKGRDEVLFQDGDQLWACRGDLTEVWSIPTHDSVREILPAAPGKTATVVLNPSLGLDAATGRPVWSIGSVRSMLKTSDERNLPRGLDGPEGATVCRVGMPAIAPGHFQARGLTARPVASRDDPRWERSLPWVSPVEPYANPIVQVGMAATLVNVCIPLLILWLATRRRFWSVRLLLALPAMAAFPLTGYPAAIAFIPDRFPPSAPWWSLPLLVAMLSVSGLPIVVYVVALASALFRRRFWRMGLLAAGTLLTAALIAATMLWSDSLVKPQIEHYNWSGWHHAVYLGVYAVGVLAILGRFARGAGRLVLRFARRGRAALSASN